MRTNQLLEAEHDFSATVGKTLDRVGSLAKQARDKFKGAYKSAEQDIKGDLEDHARAAKKQADDAKKQAGDEAAAKAAADKDAEKARKKGVASTMEQAAQNLLFGDSDPSEEDLEAISDYDASDVQHFQDVLELMQKRLALTPKLMRAALKSGFLNAQDRTDDRVNEIMSELDPDVVDRIEMAYMHGRNDSVNALWAEQLNSDDVTERQASLLKWLRMTAKENERKNDAAQGKKQYYTGSGLAKVLRGQFQIVERRMHTLRQLVKGMEGKEIKDAAGAAKAAIDGKMKESLSSLRTLLEHL